MKEEDDLLGGEQVGGVGRMRMGREEEEEGGGRGLEEDGRGWQVGLMEEGERGGRVRRKRMRMEGVLVGGGRGEGGAEAGRGRGWREW